MLSNVGRCVTIVGGRHGRAQRRRRASACDFPVLDPRPPGPASSRVAGGRRVPRTEAVCAPRVLTPRDPCARPEPSAACSRPASARGQRRRFFMVPPVGARAARPGWARQAPRGNERGSRIAPTPAAYGPGHRNRRVCAPRTDGNGSGPSQHAGLRHAAPRGAAGSRTVPRVPLVGARPGPRGHENLKIGDRIAGTSPGDAPGARGAGWWGAGWLCLLPCGFCAVSQPPKNHPKVG